MIDYCSKPMVIASGLPWSALDGVAGLAAEPTVWRSELGESFEVFRAFLEMPADGKLWRINRPALGNALCTALGLQRKTTEFPLPATGQIGSWSAEAVPAILTIQHDQREFRAVVAELVARLRRPFILLGPTCAHVDAACQELFAHGDAAFFGLDTHVVLTAQGNLQCRQSPGEIFARFTPQPKAPLADYVARQALGLMQQLDAQKRSRPPSLLTVFRLYCMEEMTAEEIARRCRCGTATISRRLKTIRAKTGRAPAELRRVSAHLNRIEEDLGDSRG